MIRKAFALGAMYTVSASAAVTLTYPALTDYLLIEPKSHDLSITFDGSTPTSTAGFHITKDIPTPVWVGPDMVLKIYAKSGNPAIYVQPFRSKLDEND
jgi:hypothetical protein